MDTQGYYTLRNQLKSFHAEKVKSILKKVHYDERTIEEVQGLIRKKHSKTKPESQILEDVVCMVFLQHYYDEFAADHLEEKVVEILHTWRKMSREGRQKALELPLSETIYHLTNPLTILHWYNDKIDSFFIRNAWRRLL